MSCFCQGSKFFSIFRTGVQMPWKRRRSWTADTFLWPHRNHAKPRRDRGGRSAVSAAFSVAGTHLHPSPVSASAVPFWEFPVQSGLPLPGRNCTARTHHFAKLGGASLIFRVLRLRRLRLPLPLCARQCRCGRLLDALGHHHVHERGSWGDGASQWKEQERASAGKQKAEL